jgi:hypothetical protein
MGHDTKSREVIWGGQILGANIRAEGAREEAHKAVKAADRAEAEAWSIRMEGYGGPAQPSPTPRERYKPTGEIRRGIACGFFPEARARTLLYRAALRYAAR